MITVTVKSNYDECLAMNIAHDEIVELSELDDILDKIQDVYSYIFARNNQEIRFLIEDNWIESRLDKNCVFVYYHSKYNMFERICTSYEIKILDDDTIYLHCFDRDRMVSCTKLM